MFWIEIYYVPLICTEIIFLMSFMLNSFPLTCQWAASLHCVCFCFFYFHIIIVHCTMIVFIFLICNWLKYSMLSWLQRNRVMELIIRVFSAKGWAVSSCIYSCLPFMVCCLIQHNDYCICVCFITWLQCNGCGNRHVIVASFWCALHSEERRLLIRPL